MPDYKEQTEEAFESHSMEEDSNYDLISQRMKLESERKVKLQNEEIDNLSAMFKNKEAEKKRKALMGKFMELEEEEVRASQQSIMKEGGGQENNNYGYKKSQSLAETLKRKDFDITE